MKKFLTDLLFMLAGGFIWAVALNTFLVPNLIASGGVVGLATVANHFFSVPVGVATILLNLPVFAFAFRKMGWRFVLKTFFAMMLTSVIIDITALFLPAFTEDKLFAAILGGVFSGIGLGIIYARGIATGGTDLLARLVDDVLPMFSYGKLILLFDACVVLIAAVSFRDWNSALYATISIYLVGVVVDAILSGPNKGNLVYVISSREREIGDGVLQKLRRGATVLYGKGRYTEKERGVIMIVVRSYELHKLKELVKTIDPGAFVVVGDVSEISGEGFGILA